MTDRESLPNLVCQGRGPCFPPFDAPTGESEKSWPANRTAMNGTSTGDATVNHEHTPRCQEDAHTSHAAGSRPYLRLALMAVLSFAAMYFLMYATVNALENVYHIVNQFYMAGLMAAPMVIIELALMRRMYPNRKINAAILAASLLATAAFWGLIRRQAAVADEQFVRSMIPHHAGAILMCDEASLTDPELKRLCESIKTSQQAEIDQMKVKLTELQTKCGRGSRLGPDAHVRG